MPFGPIAPAMVLVLVRMASQGGADADARAWHRKTRPDAATDDFWPEISSQYGLKNPVPLKAEKAPKRVLLEVFAVLAVAGSLAVAAALLWPG